MIIDYDLLSVRDILRTTRRKMVRILSILKIGAHLGFTTLGSTRLDQAHHGVGGLTATRRVRFELFVLG